METMQTPQMPQQPIIQEQPVIDRLLVDIPFVNPCIWIRVRVPIVEKAKNIKEKDKYLLQAGNITGTNNAYVKLGIIQPLVFINVRDFGGMKWDCITMNSFHLMRFKNALRKIMVRIQTPNLFYYMEGVLKLNTEVAEPLNIELPIFKTIVYMNFTVVSKIMDTSDTHIEYEGISISVNGNSINFLTVDEIQLLYETLSEINTIELGILASKYAKPIIVNQ